MYAFDLSADLQSDSAMKLIRKESLRLRLRFAKALRENIQLIALEEFTKLVEVNLELDNHNMRYSVL